MKPRQPSPQQILSLCSAPDHDDGLDPRRDERSIPRRGKHRKTLQLCAQVARTLNSIFAGGCRDDVLRDLTVLAVEPAPGTARLLVTVHATVPAGTIDVACVLERLGRAAGMLRAEVAAAIHRRRAPELTFRVAVKAG